jgi:hypothetical protein
MKALFAILGLALPLFTFNALGQVTVDVTLDQEQFLPGEALPVSVHITNRSGQTLHLGDGDWLSFLVESDDGSVVIKKSDPPVNGSFDLGTSEVATKRVDVSPYFILNRAGQYHIVATVHIKDWNSNVNSSPTDFDVIRGAELWSEEFGVPGSSPPNQPPLVRKYTLVEANYLRDQLRLYVQISDESAGSIVKVRAIGPMISFSSPEAQTDPAGDLHVLWQSGASTFTYSIVDSDGNITQHEIYDYVTSRPRLTGDTNGNIVVLGGVRRLEPTEMPLVKSPDQLP